MSGRLGWTRFELAAFAVCAALALAALWTPAALPLADLPQHMAQLTLFERLDDPSWRFAPRFWLDVTTPYLGYALLGRALGAALDVDAAVRVLLSAAALGLPLALRALLRRAGGDPAWALLGFPLAFAFPFAMGFLNYVLGLPLALCVLAGAIALAREPRWRLGVAVAALALVCFVIHGVAWAAGAGLGASAALAWGADARARAAGALGVLAPLPLALAWYGLDGLDYGDLGAQPEEWGAGPGRLLALPQVLLGADPATTALSLGAALALILGARGLTPERRRWWPALASGGAYVLAPQVFSGVAHIADRLAVLPALLLPLALEPIPPSRRRRFARALLVGVTAGWLALLGARLHRVGAQADDVRALARHLPDGALVFSIPVDGETWHTGAPAAWHFGQLLLLERDVLVEPSFAHWTPNPIRYREGQALPIPEADPRRALAEGPYTHALVRSPEDRRAEWAATLHELGGWRELAREGEWTLYVR